ncbi:MAG: hypothetical protein ACON4E_05180 [Flavobacteriales bacterium]
MNLKMNYEGFSSLFISKEKLGQSQSFFKIPQDAIDDIIKIKIANWMILFFVFIIFFFPAFKNTIKVIN